MLPTPKTKPPTPQYLSAVKSKSTAPDTHPWGSIEDIVNAPLINVRCRANPLDPDRAQSKRGGTHIGLPTRRLLASFVP